MPAELRYKRGTKQVKKVFFEINHFEGIPLFPTSAGANITSYRDLPSDHTSLSEVRVKWESRFFCKRCHGSLEFSLLMQELKLSPEQPYADGSDSPYLTEVGLCLLASEGEEILKEPVTGLKLNKDVVVRGHQGEVLKELKICQLLFEGKHAIFEEELIPATGNCCWNCGYHPIFCDQCFRKETTVRDTGICPKCKSELIQDTDTKQPEKAIIQPFPSTRHRTLNPKYWQGDDFFGGVHGVATSRGASAIKKVGIRYLFAKPILAWLDECTPEQVKKIEELAKIKIE